MQWDFKDIAAGALPPKPDNNGSISGRIVLQIQKMRNISAPKANEESTAAPRFLQLELSDGVNTVAALEFERIASLNLNVPPGTKLFFKSEKLKLINGFIVLKSSEVQVLGGKVETLFEKWEVARQMLKYARSNRRLSGSGGPPPWIAFGKRLDVHKDALPTDRNFKSLQVANEKDKNSKENDEFNASRSQAIAEAAKAGQKKVFGGGQQNILDHNVKKILEKGYSEEEAKQALKATNNNLERALYNLKRRNNNRNGSTENSVKSATSAQGGRGRDKGSIATAKEEAAAAKPQSNVSLFDFLTDKLPVVRTIISCTIAMIIYLSGITYIFIFLQTASSSSNTQPAANNVNTERVTKEHASKTLSNNKTSTVLGNRFENNMSSSFAANRATNNPRTDEKETTQSRPSNFNQKQEDRKQQPNNKVGRSGERNNPNKTQVQTSNYEKPTMPKTESNTNVSGLSNNNKRNERPLKKDREQTPKQTVSDYQPNKRNNDYNKSSEKKSYYSRENNRNTNKDVKNNTSNYQHREAETVNSFEKALDNLVDSTSKLTLQNKKDPASTGQQIRNRNQQQNTRNNNHSQIPNTGGQQMQQKSPSENYNTSNSQQQSNSQNFSSKSFSQNSKSSSYPPQMGNGFSYDPSKIMGFQSKEANEYAMSLLKSQGLTMQQLQQQQSITSQQSAALQPPPLQPQLPQPQILNNQATAVAYMTPNPNLMVGPPQQAPAQYGVMSSANWPWKIGDLCLAKYWDDGNVSINNNSF